MLSQNGERIATATPFQPVLCVSKSVSEFRRPVLATDLGRSRSVVASPEVACSSTCSSSSGRSAIREVLDSCR
jgi:hypothetical protein